MRLLSGNKCEKLTLLLFLALIAGKVDAADAIVIRSAQSARAITPGDVESSLNNWTAVWLDLLTSAGLTADTASEAILESDTKGKLLILPNVSHLSDKQLTGLERHLDAGYGVLMTWAVATRDEHNGWRGWDFLNETTGGSIQTSSIETGKAMAFQMRGGVPGGCAIPPGYYLRFTPYVSPMFFVAGDSNAIGGYWTSDGFKDTASAAANRMVGVVVRQRPSGGRIVWLGANLDGLHVDSTNRVMAIKWAREIFHWLNGAGVAEITPWPNGNRCAMMVHGDIEDQFDKVQRITSVFRRLNIPSTFNILTNEASRFPSAMESILSTKAQLGIHGDSHAPFTGQSYELQLQRMNKASGYLSLHGPRPTSFRPPELGYDNNTLKAAKTAGITHFLADESPDRDYPRYIPEGSRYPGAGLVFFPKGELDDYDLFVKVNVSEPSRMSDVMLREFDRVYDERGLYKLNYHSQFLAIEHFPQTIETTLKRILQRSNVWRATAQEVNMWIRQREGLILTASSTPSSVEVTLRNVGLNPVREAVLRILPPRDVPAELMEAKSISQNCEMNVVDGALYVKLPPMKPESNFSLVVGPSGGGGLSAKHKKTLNVMFNVGATIGGILILWFVFYLLFPKKSQYSQAAVSVRKNSEAYEIPKIDKSYPVHEKSVRVRPTEPLPAQSPLAEVAATVTTQPEPKPTPTAATEPTPTVRTTGIRFEEPPKRIERELVASKPSVQEISGIRFEEVLSRNSIDTLEKQPNSSSEEVAAKTPIERTEKAAAIIITAATVDEDTPKLKPIERSMKIAPARRHSDATPVRMKAPSYPKPPVNETAASVTRLPEASESKPAEQTEVQATPSKEDALNRVLASLPKKLPDTFLQGNAKPLALAPGTPVGKSVYYSPTGSRSTAVLPKPESKKEDTGSTPKGTQSTPTEQPEAPKMGGQGFVRTSVEILNKRRTEITKKTDEEWR